MGLDGRYANAKAIKSIPNAFERDIDVSNSYTLRMKKRFNWDIHTDICERKQKIMFYSKRRVKMS